MAPITCGGRTADTHGRRHQQWRLSRAGGHLTGSAYVPRTIAPSRVTRRLHGLDLFGDLLVRTRVTIRAVVSDSLPICRRARVALPPPLRPASVTEMAGACVRGAAAKCAYNGSCAAKNGSGAGGALVGLVGVYVASVVARVVLLIRFLEQRARAQDINQFRVQHRAVGRRLLTPASGGPRLLGHTLSSSAGADEQAADYD